jgi:hypothetical protein
MALTPVIMACAASHHCSLRRVTQISRPAGLRSFRLRQADREVLFSLDPLAGDAYISLYAAGQEMVSIGRLRRVEKLTVVKRDGYEGLELVFIGARHDPVILQTRPVIRLSWDVAPLGSW